MCLTFPFSLSLSIYLSFSSFLGLFTSFYPTIRQYSVWMSAVLHRVYLTCLESTHAVRPWWYFRLSYRVSLQLTPLHETRLCVRSMGFRCAMIRTSTSPHQVWSVPRCVTLQRAQFVIAFISRTLMILYLLHFEDDLFCACCGRGCESLPSSADDKLFCVHDQVRCVSRQWIFSDWHSLGFSLVLLSSLITCFVGWKSSIAADDSHFCVDDLLRACCGSGVRFFHQIPIV